MENFVLIGWPEIQEVMDEPEFEKNSSLLTPNENLGIDCSTYLVSKEWLSKLD